MAALLEGSTVLAVVTFGRTAFADQHFIGLINL
jgi:hypothetical protein